MNAERSTNFRQIIQRFRASYVSKHKLPIDHEKVLWCVEHCRTAALGGHIDQCTSCGHLQVSYNSCGNRHCPKCQWPQQQKWIAARMEEVLPVPYYHVVFTLPKELHSLAVHYPREMYDLLFRASWSALKSLCSDYKYLGAQIGMISVLHTWGQNLSLHPHVHCIVPGGGLSFDGKRRKATKRKNFLVPVKALSKLFKHLYLTKLKDRITGFDGSKVPLKECINQAYQKDWVVYAKRPFAGPEQVIQYLGRYTHRVAISESRLSRIEGGRVYFKYKDYREEGKQKETSLKGEAFLRRFVQHILPPRFTKIRYFGLLSTRNRTTKLALCQQLARQTITKTVEKEEKVEKKPKRPCCQLCGALDLIRVVELPARWARAPPSVKNQITSRTKCKKVS